MARDGDQKTQTRKRILVEAAALLHEVGPEAMRITDVMARAGLTHGGFYSHFKSKDELVAETITDMFVRQHATFMSSLGQPDAGTALIALVEGYLSTFHLNATDQACPMPPLAGCVTWLPGTARERFQTGFRSLSIGVASLLARMGCPDAASTATSIICEMVGALSLARTMDDAGEAECVLVASRSSIIERLRMPH